MKVVMHIQIQGSRNGVRWPEAGSVVDLGDGEANDLISLGYATKVEPAKKAAVKPAPEQAVAPAPEKRAAKKR